MADPMSYLQKIQACLLDGRTSHLDDEDIAYFVGRAIGLSPEQLQQPVGRYVVVPVEPTPEMMAAGERADWVGIVEGRAGMSIGPYPPEDWQREDIEQGAYSDPIEDRRGIWTAMLSARPGAKEGGA